MTRLCRFRWFEIITAVLAVTFLATSASFAGQAGPTSTAPQNRAQSTGAGQANGPTTTLSGTVRTSNGEGVPGAVVRATRTESNQAWVTWTDESGKFEFPSIPAGSYVLEAVQLGFEKLERQVQVAAGLPPPPIQLTLRVASLADLQGSGEPSTTQRRFPGAPGRRGFNGPGGAPGAAQQPAGGPGPVMQGGRGRFGGRGQLPAGVVNALNQGLANRGFQQTGLTGDAAANGPADEIAGADLNSGPAAPAGVGTTSSDAFLLQGTVGQGLSSNGPRGFGPGGFGPGGPGGLTPPDPGGPGGPGMLGGPGAPQVQGGPGGGQQAQGGQAEGGPGGPQRVFVAAGGGGGGRGPVMFAGGRGGGGGMFFRQQVNRMRFTFYDRLDNSAFDARPYAITGQESPKLSHYDNRFGVNLGGPLKIPHIYNGSDKTYFFANYQHDTASSAVNTFSTVPTLDERNGLFCGTTLYEPFSNPATPYPTVADANCTGGVAQQIPINSAAAGLLAYIPKANLSGSIQNFLLQATEPTNTDNLNTHVLHTINSKFNVNGGYNFESERSTNLSNFPGIGGPESSRDQSVDLSLSHNWSPRLVESTSVNWSRSRIQLRSFNSNGANIAQQLGITGVSAEPIDYGIPQISFTNFSGIQDPIPSLVRDQTLRFDDGLTWVHGSHTMQFGGEIRRMQFNTDSSPNPRGQFVFTGLVTSELTAAGVAVPGTGNDFADFLLGYPFSTSAQFGNPNTYFRSWGFSAYAQDDWRVSKVFTLLYGIRYDAVTPPVELFNNIVNLDMNPNIATLAASGTQCLTPTSCVSLVLPGQTGPFSGVFPQALIHGDYNNWAPRVGFAWQPKFIKPRTVVRGGYSIFYNESGYDTLAKELAYQPPVSTAQTLTTSSSQKLTLENGFLPQQGSGLILNTQAVDPFYKNAYAQIWTLGTETSFSPNWILDLTYTGTKGTNLDILRAPNRAPLGTSQANIQSSRVDPNAAGFTFDQSGANSIYNALQVRVVHRFTHGLMLQGIYTFGKSLDDASSIGGGTGTVQQIDGDLAAERGLSTFDIRHQLRLFSMYELPFGQRSRWANHGWTEKLFGDWRLMNIFTWQTGTPFTALLGGTASDNGTGANFSLRAEQIGNPNVGICGGSPLSFFNGAAFGLPPTDVNGNPTYGNERRGAIEGPCTLSWNMSIAKTYRFGPERRHMLNVQWQIQNLTNTPSFNGLGTVFGSSFFGQVTNASSMRTMTLMARFNF